MGGLGTVVREQAAGRQSILKLRPFVSAVLSCSSVCEKKKKKEIQVLIGYRERVWRGALGFDPGVGWKLNFCPRENSFFGRSFVAIGGKRENHDRMLGRRNAEGSCAGITESLFLVS